MNDLKIGDIVFCDNGWCDVVRAFVIDDNRPDVVRVDAGGITFDVARNECFTTPEEAYGHIGPREYDE